MATGDAIDLDAAVGLPIPDAEAENLVELGELAAGQLGAGFGNEDPGPRYKYAVDKGQSASHAFNVEPEVFFNVSRVIIAKNAPKGIRTVPAANMCWGTVTQSTFEPRGKDGRVHSITLRDPKSPQSRNLRGQTNPDQTTAGNVATAYNEAVKKEFMYGTDEKIKLYDAGSFMSLAEYSEQTPNQAPEYRCTKGPGDAAAARPWNRLLAVVNDRSTDGMHKSNLNMINNVHELTKDAIERYQNRGAGDGPAANTLIGGENVQRLLVRVGFPNKKLPGEDPAYNNTVTRSVVRGYNAALLGGVMEQVPKGPAAVAMADALEEYTFELVKSMLNSVKADDENSDPKTTEIEVKRAKGDTVQKVTVAEALINDGITLDTVGGDNNTEFVRFMYPHPEEIGFYRAEDMIRTIVVEFEPFAEVQGEGEGTQVKLGNKMPNDMYNEAYMRSRVSKLRHYVVACVYSDLNGQQHIDTHMLESVSEIDKARDLAFTKLTQLSGAPVIGDPFPNPTASVSLFTGKSRKVDPSNRSQAGEANITTLIKGFKGAIMGPIHGTIASANPNAPPGTRSERIYKEAIANPRLMEMFTSEPVIQDDTGIITVKRARTVNAEFGGIVGNLRRSAQADVVLRNFLARLPQLDDVKTGSDEFSILPDRDLETGETNMLGGYLGASNLADNATIGHRHKKGLRTRLQLRPLQQGKTDRSEKMIIAPRVNQIFKRLESLLGYKSLTDMEDHELRQFNHILTTFFDNSTQNYNLLFVSCILDKALSYERIAGINPTKTAPTPRQTQVVMAVRNLCQRLLDVTPFAHELGRGIFINVIVNDVLGRIIQIFNMSTSQINRTLVGVGLDRVGATSTRGQAQMFVDYKERIIRSCYDAIACIAIKHKPEGAGVMQGNTLFGFPLTKADRATSTELTIDEVLSKFNNMARDLRVQGTPASIDRNNKVRPITGETPGGKELPTEGGLKAVGEDAGVNELRKKFNYYALALGESQWQHVWLVGSDLSEHVVLQRNKGEQDRANLLYGDDFTSRVERQKYNAMNKQGLFMGQLVNSDGSAKFIDPNQYRSRDVEARDGKYGMSFQDQQSRVSERTKNLVA
jgi:hypothetical protein